MQRVVQAAQAISAKVHRHVGVPERPQPAVDELRGPGLERAGVEHREIELGDVPPADDVRIDGDAITRTLKAKIANFKVPKAVFVVAELPRNAMGKVQKNLLREQHKALFA